MLVVCAVRGPRNQGTLGAVGVSTAHGGPGGLAPVSRLPAAVAQRLCSGPRATLSQDAWGMFSRAGCGGEEEFSGLRGEQGERCV